MTTGPDQSLESEQEGVLGKPLDRWEEFKNHLEDARDDFVIVLDDLNEARHSLEQLAGDVQDISGEVRHRIQTRIQDLTDRFDSNSSN